MVGDQEDNELGEYSHHTYTLSRMRWRILSLIGTSPQSGPKKKERCCRMSSIVRNPSLIDLLLFSVRAVGAVAFRYTDG